MKIGRIGLITGLIGLMLLVGCATQHITGRTFEGGLLGAGLGALVGGEKGALIGGAIGGALGHWLGTKEEMGGKTLVPVSQTTSTFSTGPGVPGAMPMPYGYENDYCSLQCADFYTPGARASCERGCRSSMWR